jgi:hypothetical protein
MLLLSPFKQRQFRLSIFTHSWRYEPDYWRATTPIIEFWPIEQQSCSELTGFQVRSERCCGDFWPLIAPLELLPC